LADNDVDLELRCFKVHAPAQAALREVLNSLQSKEMCSPASAPNVSSGGGGCSQATALLARMGGGQNTTAVTNLICGMVTDGTWSLMDVFYVFAINSTGNAALNWVSSSFPITVTGTCTFAANQGYTGDGSTCYLTKGYNFSSSATNFAQNSGSMGACNFNAAANAETLMGGQQSGTYNEMGFSASAIFYDINDGAFPSFTFTNTSGNWMASRTGASALALYLNGNSVATSTGSSLTVPSTTAIILALDGGTGTGIQFSTAQIGVAFVGAGLTSGQANSVFSRIHTYLGAVGAPSGC
jgi:hypothetical protein